MQRKRSALEKTFLAELNTAIAALNAEQQRDLVLKIFDKNLADRLDARIATQLRVMIARFQTWADKYGVSLDQLETGRTTTAQRLRMNFQELGYES